MMILKRHYLTIIFVILIGLLHSSVTWFINDKPDYPKIIIRGGKPEGSHVVLWASYYIGGEQCDKYTFSALDMKAHRGGVQNVKYKDNLTNSQIEYLYKIRYQNYIDDKCEVILDEIQIKAFNQVDSESGFAELNLSNIREDSINENGLVNPVSEAKECRTRIKNRPNGTWIHSIICDMYINGKLEEENMASNYRARFDFSKLKPNQEIVYNIIPGPDYKDGHFNEKTGKIEDE